MNVGESSTILLLFWVTFMLIFLLTLITPKVNLINSSGFTGPTGNVTSAMLKLSSGSVIRLKNKSNGQYLTAVCEPWILTPDGLSSDPITHFTIQRQNGFISIQSVFTEKYLSVSSNGLVSVSNSLSDITGSNPNYETWFEFLFTQPDEVLIHSRQGVDEVGGRGGYLSVNENIQACGHPILIESNITETNINTLTWKIEI